MELNMTPEQRLDRAERILITMIKSGRRTRSEWRYKINSLVDAQIRHEEMSRMRSAKIDEQLLKMTAAQAQNQKAIAELNESQKLTDKALRAFIASLRKGRNGKSSD